MSIFLHLFCPYFALRFLSVYSEAHCYNVLDPSLQLIMLLHGRYSFRGPSEDQITLLKRDEVADVTDQIRDRENHLGGAAVLPQLIVHPEPQLDVARVGNALLGNKLADRAGSVESLG